jgi:hypothetical protein
MNSRRFMGYSRTKRHTLAHGDSGSVRCITACWPMSESGQSRSSGDVRVTSAFPRIATKSRTSRHVGDGPQPDDPVIEGLAEVSSMSLPIAIGSIEHGRRSPDATTRVHHLPRRRSGGLAARGAGAVAARPNDWVSLCGFAKREPRGGIPQGFERNGLRRPPEPRNYMETT